MKLIKKFLSVTLSMGLALSIFPAASPCNVYAADYSGLKNIQSKYNGSIPYFSEGLALIVKYDKKGNMKYGFINKQGKVVIAPKFESASDFHEGLSQVAKMIPLGHKMGFINKKGKLVIPYKFSETTDFENGIAVVRKLDSIKDYESTTNYSFINKKGKRSLPYKYSEISAFPCGLVKLSKYNKKNDSFTYTFCNRDGKFKNKKSYEFAGDSMNDNMLIVGNMKEDGFKYGFLDKTGKEVIPLIYDSAENFSDGLAAVSKGEKSFFINTKGKTVISNDAISSNFSEGLAVVSTDEGLGYIDKQGNIVIAGKYESAEPFKNGFARVSVNNEEGISQYGYINKEGKEIVPPKYDYCRDFNEGVAVVRKNEKYGFINKEGKEIVRPKYDDFKDFENGIAAVGIYNDNEDLVKGYINKKGKLIIPVKYVELTEFQDGFAVINYKYLVDTKGKIYK